MPREVTDGDGVTWTCAQAYAGLGGGDDREKAEAARVDGTRDRYRVVCTPSGGAQSVELELPGGWEQSMGDADLLAAIHGASAEG
jgi:hypothetical protein